MDPRLRGDDEHSGGLIWVDRLIRKPAHCSSEAFAKFIVEDQKKGRLLVEISAAQLAL